MYQPNGHHLERKKYLSVVRALNWSIVSPARYSDRLELRIVVFVITVLVRFNLFLQDMLSWTKFCFNIFHFLQIILIIIVRGWATALVGEITVIFTCSRLRCRFIFYLFSFVRAFISISVSALEIISSSISQLKVFMSTTK